MSGRKVFTAGEVLQAADVNDFLMDQSVMVFAGTAARGSAIPSPTEGMVTYRSDDDVVEVYNGASFVPVGPGQILQVVTASTSTQITTTSTTFQDSGLSVTITPSSVDSKIVVLIGQAIGGYNSSSSNVLRRVRTLRDAVEILAPGGYNFGIFQAGTGNIEHYSHYAVALLDSPSTTSAVTYKTQIATIATSGGTVLAQSNGATSTITVMEVAG